MDRRKPIDNTITIVEIQDSIYRIETNDSDNKIFSLINDHYSIVIT